MNKMGLAGAGAVLHAGWPTVVIAIVVTVAAAFVVNRIIGVIRSSIDSHAKTDRLCSIIRETCSGIGEIRSARKGRGPASGSSNRPRPGRPKSADRANTDRARSPRRRRR
jgi:hypothetical protein